MARTTGSRGVGGRSAANIAHYLKGIDFPASKDDLITHAKENDAEDVVIEELGKMPDHEYTNMADVMKGYGEEH